MGWHMNPPKSVVSPRERGSVMPALMVATTSVAALAAAYLTKVASDITESKARDNAVRASKNAVANLEIARNIVGPVREREAQKLGFELMKRHGVQLFYDRLDPPEAQGAAE